MFLGNSGKIGPGDLRSVVSAGSETRAERGRPAPSVRALCFSENPRVSFYLWQIDIDTQHVGRQLGFYFVFHVEGRVHHKRRQRLDNRMGATQVQRAFIDGIRLPNICALGGCGQGNC